MTAAAPLATSALAIDEARERRVAWRLVLLVLAVLTLVKPLGGIPVVGTVGFTIAAALQLYLPLWRAEKLDVPYGFFGLHLEAWRRDLRILLVLCAIAFPPYVLAHHLYMTAFHDWARELGLGALAGYFPRRVLAPAWPTGVVAWLAGAWWLVQIVATHTLGVALPEEAFYRGYLQPRLESAWPPARRILGVPFGRAAVVAAALFAAGHFLGEWNPLRWGPFFPALVFAWQRNATRSVAGAVTFHAACNVFGELLASLYR